MNTATILWGVLFGAIGSGYLAYGKKQKALIPLVCGLRLMVFPYFISNAFILVVVGVAIAAVPYFVRA